MKNFWILRRRNRTVEYCLDFDDLSDRTPQEKSDAVYGFMVDMNDRTDALFINVSIELCEYAMRHFGNIHRFSLQGSAPMFTTPGLMPIFGDPWLRDGTFYMATRTGKVWGLIKNFKP